MERSRGGWVVRSEYGYWLRTANSQHSDAVGEWVKDPNHASVWSDEASAQSVADLMDGEPWDLADACESYAPALPLCPVCVEPHELTEGGICLRSGTEEPADCVETPEELIYPDDEGQATCPHDIPLINICPICEKNSDTDELPGAGARDFHTENLFFLRPTSPTFERFDVFGVNGGGCVIVKQSDGLWHGPWAAGDGAGEPWEIAMRELANWFQPVSTPAALLALLDHQISLARRTGRTSGDGAICTHCAHAHEEHEDCVLPDVPYYVQAINRSALGDTLDVTPCADEYEAMAVLAYVQSRRDAERPRLVITKPGSRKMQLVCRLAWRTNAKQRGAALRLVGLDPHGRP